MALKVLLGGESSSCSLATLIGTQIRFVASTFQIMSLLLVTEQISERSKTEIVASVYPTTVGFQVIVDKLTIKVQEVLLASNFVKMQTD